MQGLKFAENFARRRKQLGMTQSDVAAYAGVSSAAVSKWEQGLSYPDLTLLPKLATLLDVTIDALLGYEPQLTKHKILELYSQFANRFAVESFEAVQADIEAMLKEYYACYPFLIRMAQLYLNYYPASAQPELIWQRIIELCERTVTHSGDYRLSEEARMIHASVLLMSGRPQELLEHLGEDITIHYGAEQMIAHAYAMLGDQQKAKLTMQASMFQHLFGLIIGSIESLLLEVENEKHFDEIVRRLEQLLSLFNVEAMNINQVFIFYFKAAIGYMQQQRPQEALRMLEQYYKVCSTMKLPIQINGDDYFYLIDEWIARDVHLSVQPPRDELSIKKDLLNIITSNPGFSPLHDEPAFKAIVSNLRHQLQL